MPFDEVSPNHIALTFDNDEQYVLTHKTSKFVLGSTPYFFDSKQMKTALHRNTFTTQDAVFYSNAPLINF